MHPEESVNGIIISPDEKRYRGKVFYDGKRITPDFFYADWEEDLEKWAKEVKQQYITSHPEAYPLNKWELRIWDNY